MYKKSLILTIIFIFMLVMAGCGSNNSNNSGEEGNTQEQVEEEERSSQEQEGEEEINSQRQTDESTQEVKEDSGTYVGRIDSNFIEIKISGVPEEKAAKSFMLSQEMKEEFESYGFNEGDPVHFTYKVNEHGNNLLQSIEIIENE